MMAAMVDILSEVLERAGGASRLAASCAVSPQAVWKWKERGRVPAERVLTVERITGVSRHRLRPDLYPEAQ